MPKHATTTLTSVLLLLTIPNHWFATAVDPLGSSTRDARSSRNAPSDDAEFRIREGIELTNEVGEFQVAGERIRFRPRDRNVKLTVLENTALERVSRVLDETRTPPTWSVSGRITEYHGSNFLLITRAVVKSRR
jgi:hypothetical protein